MDEASCVSHSRPLQRLLHVRTQFRVELHRDHVILEFVGVVVLLESAQRVHQVEPDDRDHEGHHARVLADHFEVFDDEKKDDQVADI